MIIIEVFIMVVSLFLRFIIALIPTFIKLLKKTGLWFVVLYIVVVLILGVFVFKLNGNESIPDYLNLGLVTANDYAIFGLYLSIGISGVILIFKLVKVLLSFIKRIIDKNRGY